MIFLIYHKLIKYKVQFLFIYLELHDFCFFNDPLAVLLLKPPFLLTIFFWIVDPCKQEL